MKTRIKEKGGDGEQGWEGSEAEDHIEMKGTGEGGNKEGAGQEERDSGRI